MVIMATLAIGFWVAIGALFALVIVLLMMLWRDRK